MKNLMMWGIIVLLVLGLFNLFQNPDRSTATKDLPFSTFITEVEKEILLQSILKEIKLRETFQMEQNLKLIHQIIQT